MESNKYYSYKTDANTQNNRHVGLKRPGSSTDSFPKLLSQSQLSCQRDGVVFKLLLQLTDALDSSVPKASAEANHSCVILDAAGAC